jgi:DNA-binding PadR family transcriptional regulator
VLAMSLPKVLLGLLEPGPSHGYDLKHSYDKRFGTVRALPYAQVYATLARLERDDMVRVVGTQQVGGPERTTYGITAQGKRTLQSWFGEPEPPATALQSIVFTKVVLALMSGRSAQQILDNQRAAHLQLMRDLTARKRDASLTDTLALDFTLFHLEADLRWLEHTAARLDRLAEEI